MIATLSAWILLATNQTGPEQLTKKFTSEPLKARGILPGKVIAFGSQARVVATATNEGIETPMVAVAQYGKGRVAVTGHWGLWTQNADSPAWKSLLEWLSVGTRGVGVVGSDGALPTGYRTYPDSDWTKASQENSVLILGPGAIRTDADARRLESFIVAGGGVLAMDTPWGWLQIHPGKTLSQDHPLQSALAKAGVGFADGLVDTARDQIQFKAPLPEHHSLVALERFESPDKISSQAAKACAEVLMLTLRDGSTLAPEVRRIQKSIAEGGMAKFATSEQVIGPDDFRSRVAASAYDTQWRRLKPSQVRPHPAHRYFPGEVPADAERSTANLTIGGGKKRWWSTGRYAPAGQTIRVTVERPSSMKSRVRIGGHTDTLWHKATWERFPSISSAVRIESEVTELANPFGGLIYIETDGRELPETAVKIEGSVAAPVYFPGMTQEEWMEARLNPAPWAEIVGEQCAISVPSTVVRNLENAGEIMNFFDEMVRKCEELYAVPVGTTEQRYQVDQQISAGYMHAGYPIMTGPDVASRFVDISVLRGPKGDPNWGFYHEVGHNYQLQEWTLDGWGETTNNLFSLYGVEFFNRDLPAHSAMNASKVLDRANEVLKSPGEHRWFEKDPWYGLTFWELFRREFGFAPMTEYFRWCQTAPKSAFRDEQARCETMVRELSRIVGRDLSGYFEAWGLPIGKTVQVETKKYPMWMPTEFKALAEKR